MKKASTEAIGTLLFQICLLTDNLISQKGIMSESTISKIVSNTQDYNLEQQEEFYTKLIPVLESATTEEQILENAQSIKKEIADIHLNDAPFLVGHSGKE